MAAGHVGQGQFDHGVVFRDGDIMAEPIAPP
jgi:hypothetical protein